MQYMVLKEKRDMLKVLRKHKLEMINALRIKRREKKAIDEQMSVIRLEIKRIKGDVREGW